MHSFTEGGSGERIAESRRRSEGFTYRDDVPRTRFYFRRLGDAFPAANPLSRVMWSLMAIRSDLTLELSQVGRDDERSRGFIPHEFLARMYFFRGTLRSVYSAHHQLSRLTARNAVGTEFQELAEIQGRWEEFVEARRAVGRASNQFNNLRNNLGAHTEESLERSLANPDPDTLVTMSITDEGALGLDFGAEAFLAALSVEFGTRDEAAFEAALEALRDVTRRAERCIDLAIVIYAQRYPVLHQTR